MISLILIIVAGIADAFMDIFKIWPSSRWAHLTDKNRWYRWAGPHAWKNKWADGSTTKERFWLSSTALVFVTDGWHFFQMIWRMAFTLAVVFHHQFLINWWADLLIYSIAYLIPFNLFYDYILKGKKIKL